MLINLGVLVLSFLTLLGLLRLTWKSIRSKRLAVRIAGTLAAGPLALVFGIMTVAMAVGMVKAYAPRGNSVREMTVQVTPERVARGEHIARFVCSGCHTIDGNLPLTGGEDFAEEIPLPIGSFTPPNLTPGSRIKDWSDGELRRAIREGAGPERETLTFMASLPFRHFSEEDIQSVIAYLRSQPAVEKPTKKERISPVGLVMIAVGAIKIPSPPGPDAPPAVPKGPTTEFGRYLANVLACTDCHGKDLHGGSGGLAPKGPTLQVVKGWTEEQFRNTLRTGVTPAGRSLEPDEMPWEFFGKMDDVELAALYAYLKGVP